MSLELGLVTDIRQIIMNFFLTEGLFLFTVGFWFLRDQSYKFLTEMLPFWVSKKKLLYLWDVYVWCMCVCFPYFMVENGVLVLSKQFLYSESNTNLPDRDVYFKQCKLCFKIIYFQHNTWYYELCFLLWYIMAALKELMNRGLG